jgi:hypothetical protein
VLTPSTRLTIATFSLAQPTVFQTGTLIGTVNNSLSTTYANVTSDLFLNDRQFTGGNRQMILRRQAAMVTTTANEGLARAPSLFIGESERVQSCQRVRSEKNIVLLFVPINGSFQIHCQFHRGRQPPRPECISCFSAVARTNF